MELSKAYDPKAVESKIYALWEKSGFFNPDKLPVRHKKPFCIVIPPPNITGELHMGHALQHTIHDIIIRKKRMQGFKTLCVPGTDHAGIATQNVVEKELKKEGQTRFDLGREKFIERIWQWQEKYGNIILDQLKKLGASYDWSRTRFTMDEDYVKAVETAFNHYYKKGWIYQGERTVNWCPRCQTSLSDLEIEYKEEKTHLWHIKYPIDSKPRKYIIVATTRPETMLGDTAVAVNPKDKRYKDLIGQKVVLPIQNRKIPIIADPKVDQNFGTGAIKVTPAHDIHDFELAEKYKLEKIQVIGPNAKMTDKAGKYAGLPVMEARKQVTEKLAQMGLLEKTEDYVHNVARCYRCNSILEPILSKQWFLKMKELAKLATEAVKKRKVKFHSKRWEKLYFGWLKNIRDWCISRQIWWGHKIPIKGVNDILDTWFSSALWPFAVLGWPASTKTPAGKPASANDLKKFYPTDILITDRGIINLWVTRMIFSGMEFMKKEPFRKIYVHATVLTREGKRMSKSLGTGIDPIGLVDRYGADAVRFGIAWQITEGQDIKFVEDNIMMGRKFCNKLWNASRFALMKISNEKNGLSNLNIKSKKLTPADKKILNTLDKTIKLVDKNIDELQFGKASQQIYDFFWHDFCDQYIEKSKNQNTPETQQVLLHVLLNSLKLLHPFMPFVTEEIYQTLPIKNKEICLMAESWPA